jgi:glycine/D-amino acid oxidase-like deaminating enzyme
VLRDASFDGALWCPTDGVIDIHALLSGFLKGAISAGAQIRYHSTVRGIEVKDGAVTAISTDSETVRTHAVIDAAGAWAGSIGELVHAVKVPLRPCRRHLFVTAPLPWADPGWPFVWDLTHDLYFRPEAGGLLLCPCDQDEMAPGTPATEASIVELLAEKINRHLPGISNIAIKRSWAGLRTLTPDGRFVIGWDPKLNGFFWVAGIGGHGVTVSSSVGALAARLILEKGRPEAEQFSPRRFLRQSSTSIPASHSS